ncbi:M16 family metallopeptidase [Gracilibacillus alcaliphilus]|uniref:M16 family metallopeptidase n=1 Tax=Gracilibacillus alcaliphilus TaxID=1401441 RepID=UPI001EF866A5|nr:pitrilysin family protein [Gracilibacillus alcaliphilus]MBM7677982.1 putative Zn-dependent peptidase [Gracilibacillus alcaliphilus]
MLHRKELQNGMRIVLEEIQTVRSVTIGIWIKTGSRNERNSENGISHFIEHMLFKGTTNYTPQQIAEAFDAVGGEINAFTSKEYTCFYAKVLDTHKDMAMEILADMLLHSVFDEEEIEREKQVVLEEINMTEDTPDDIIHDHLAAVAYQEHPLAKPILGSKESVHRLEQSQLFQYVKDHYTADHIVVSVVGNVDASFMDKVEQTLQVETTSNSLQEEQLPTFHAGYIQGQKETEQAHLCLGFEGVSISDKDIYPMLIVNNVLGGNMSSRLFQEIREKSGLAYAIYSYHSAFIDSGMLTIYAGTSENQLKHVQDKIYTIIHQLRTQGISKKEWSNSKEQLKGLHILSLESMNSKMSRNARNELLQREHPSLDEIMNRIDQVQLEDVERLLNGLQIEQAAQAMITPK